MIGTHTRQQYIPFGLCAVSLFLAMIFSLSCRSDTQDVDERPLSGKFDSSDKLGNSLSTSASKASGNPSKIEREVDFSTIDMGMDHAITLSPIPIFFSPESPVGKTSSMLSWSTTSVDGRFIAWTNDTSNSVAIFDSIESAIILSIPLNRAYPISILIDTPLQVALLITNDGWAELWDLSRQTLRWSVYLVEQGVSIPNQANYKDGPGIRRGRGYVANSALSSRANLAVVCDTMGNILTLDLQTGDIINRLHESSGYGNCMVSYISNGDLFISSRQFDSDISIWDTRRQVIVEKLKPSVQGPSQIIALDSSRSFIVVGLKKIVQVYYERDFQFKELLNKQHRIAGVVVSPDESMLAVGIHNHAVKLVFLNGEVQSTDVFLTPASLGTKYFCGYGGNGSISCYSSDLETLMFDFYYYWHDSEWFIVAAEGSLLGTPSIWDHLRLCDPDALPASLDWRLPHQSELYSPFEVESRSNIREMSWRELYKYRCLGGGGFVQSRSALRSSGSWPPSLLFNHGDTCMNCPTLTIGTEI